MDKQGAALRRPQGSPEAGTVREGTIVGAFLRYRWRGVLLRKVEEGELTMWGTPQGYVMAGNLAMLPFMPSVAMALYMQACAERLWEVQCRHAQAFAGLFQEAAVELVVASGTAS